MRIVIKSAGICYARSNCRQFSGGGIDKLPHGSGSQDKTRAHARTPITDGNICASCDGGHAVPGRKCERGNLKSIGRRFELLSYLCLAFNTPNKLIVLIVSSAYSIHDTSMITDLWSIKYAFDKTPQSIQFGTGSSGTDALQIRCYSVVSITCYSGLCVLMLSVIAATVIENHYIEIVCVCAISGLSIVLYGMRASVRIQRAIDCD